MTAVEVYELTTGGGASDFARVIVTCAARGPYCLIGGLAVNCYVEPVYTLDADFVMIAESLPQLVLDLERVGYAVERHMHSINASPPGSELRIQFTTDKRYQAFPARAELKQVLGVTAKVACLEDIARGKIWAYSDPQRRFSKRKKDELDLIRLAETYPHLKALYPEDLLLQLRGI